MRFWKMNGAGNDFVVLNNLEEHLPTEVLPQVARTLCERHLSIGADGLMVVDAPTQGGDYKMLFFNSDGSVGEMCGNGARCICRYGYENGLAGEVQTVETTAGIVTGHRVTERLYRVRLNDPTTVKLDYPVEVDGVTYPCSYVVLKPALARGELRSIGATTLNEYQKYFEKDKALERRFQTVMVDEPDELSAISILRGLKERYENHHRVRIQDDACIAAVQLSERYISDRFLPDKAIDLMDEAAAKLRMERDSVPEDLDEITRRLKQLEIEREAIKREDDTDKLAQLDKEIAELRDKENQYRAKWEGERALVNKIQEDKQQIENLKIEAERAEREGNYGRVAEIRYGKIKALENDIAAIQQQLHSQQGADVMVREEVTADDIAEVVSRWTGIPVSRMMQSEREKLLHLEEELHKRVIGQNDAIQAVSDAVRRSRAGLQDPKRPIASFIFLGTTGVGKTELAKALAEYLFNDETMMTRIDMSEYQEKFSVSRLIGAPPGYVGYDEGGQLTEAVRRKPYSVVLFDEIEKAHPDVFNILLQVLDDGRLTDNKGRTANFKNTIIIMTSNYSEDRLRQSVRPEFLNRIDDIMTFQQLTKEEIAEVVRLQMSRVEKMLAPQGFEIKVTDAAIDYLATEGYDPDFGARPVKRAIQRLVLNDLSRKILADEVKRDKPIIIDAVEGRLSFNN